MKTFKIFYIDWFTFDKSEWKVIFSYHFDAEEKFFEEIALPKDFKIRDDFNDDIAWNILFHASIAFGISYYKLSPTQKIIVNTWNLTPAQKDFWRDFYILGLGEFFYTNNIDFRDLAFFEGTWEDFQEKISFSLEDKFLLPIGWWKDSIVTAQLLENKKSKITPYIFWKSDNIKEDFLKIYGKEKLLVSRKLSSKLFEMNEQWYYNWHVPITWLISFITFFVAYAYNYKHIIFSNEKSADIWNTKFHGEEVNHQYSKSIDFENKISLYLETYISSNMKYYSYLRDFYEIEIAKLFSKIGKEYFPYFSSCNKNFSITKKTWQKWCNNCSKCLFVYIILRPFLTSTETIDIFGEELYNKKELEKLFYEIIWISGIKPFECVWEIQEAQLWVFLFYEKNKWIKNFFLLNKFEAQVLRQEWVWYFKWLKEKYLNKN